MKHWGTPLTYVVSTVTPTDSSGVFITFYNRTGGVIGKILSGVQKSPVVELSFQLDRNGCGGGKIKLASLPGFPLIPFCHVGFRFGDSTVDQYRGFLNVQDEEGSIKYEFEYEVTGLREQLDRIKVDRTLTGPLDVALIVENLYDNEVFGVAEIGKNVNKIPTSTGVLMTTLEFSKEPVADAFEAMGIAADYDWGVDGVGDFFFLEKDETVIRSYFGWKFIEFKPVKNVEDVKNSIIVQRNKQTGGGAGWTVATIRQDATSQAKYGLRELTYKVPGFFDTTTCQTIGDALLAANKEPKISAKTRRIVTSADDILPMGTYKIIAPLQDYTEDLSDCENLTGWTVDNATLSDVALTVDTTFFISGAASLKAQYTYGSGSVITFTPTAPVKGTITRLRVYLRSPKIGSYLTIGIGATAWDEQTTSAAINTSNQFNVIEWDVDSTELGVFGIRIDHAVSNRFYIDRIEVIKRDYHHFTLNLTKSVYKLTANGFEAQDDWNNVPPDLDDYVTQLLAYSKANEYRSEDR